MMKIMSLSKFRPHKTQRWAFIRISFRLLLRMRNRGCHGTGSGKVVTTCHLRLYASLVLVQNGSFSVAVQDRGDRDLHLLLSAACSPTATEVQRKVRRSHVRS